MALPSASSFAPGGCRLGVPGVLTNDVQADKAQWHLARLVMRDRLVQTKLAAICRGVARALSNSAMTPGCR
jgi:hypothetical protein